MDAYGRMAEITLISFLFIDSIFPDRTPPHLILLGDDSAVSEDFDIELGFLSFFKSAVSAVRIDSQDEGYLRSVGTTAQLR